MGLHAGYRVCLIYALVCSMRVATWCRQIDVGRFIEVIWLLIEDCTCKAKGQIRHVSFATTTPRGLPNLRTKLVTIAADHKVFR